LQRIPVFQLSHASWDAVLPLLPKFSQIHSKSNVCTPFMQEFIDAFWSRRSPHGNRDCYLVLSFLEAQREVSQIVVKRERNASYWEVSSIPLSKAAVICHVIKKSTLRGRWIEFWRKIANS
jgi:hypothetical protein